MTFYNDFLGVHIAYSLRCKRSRMSEEFLASGRAKIGREQKTTGKALSFVQ